MRFSLAESSPTKAGEKAPSPTPSTSVMMHPVPRSPRMSALRKSTAKEAREGSVVGSEGSWIDCGDLTDLKSPTLGTPTASRLSQAVPAAGAAPSDVGSFDLADENLMCHDVRPRPPAAPSPCQYP